MGSIFYPLRLPIMPVTAFSTSVPSLGPHRVLSCIFCRCCLVCFVVPLRLKVSETARGWATSAKQSTDKVYRLSCHILLRLTPSQNHRECHIALATMLGILHYCCRTMQHSLDPVGDNLGESIGDDVAIARPVAASQAINLAVSAHVFVTTPILQKPFARVVNLDSPRARISLGRGVSLALSDLVLLWLWCLDAKHVHQGKISEGAFHAHTRGPSSPSSCPPTRPFLSHPETYAGPLSVANMCLWWSLPVRRGRPQALESNPRVAAGVHQAGDAFGNLVRNVSGLAQQAVRTWSRGNEASKNAIAPPTPVYRCSTLRHGFACL